MLMSAIDFLMMYKNWRGSMLEEGSELDRMILANCDAGPYKLDSSTGKSFEELRDEAVAKTH